MDLTKLQLSELICKHAEKKNGLHDLMEIMLESMMVAERGEFLADNPGNKGNGYRPGCTYGQGRKLEFRIPRDRYGNFHPQILAILRDQEEECDQLAGVLYTKGLTQEQVGGDKSALAADLRDVFRTGQRDYTVEMAWTKWQEMCDGWGSDYRAIKLLRNNADYKAYMTYLNYAPEIQAMIYTTNWIERLNRDFRRVTRMRTAMPNEDSVLTLMGSVAMEHKAFDRQLPNITVDRTLFPDQV